MNLTIEGKNYLMQVMEGQAPKLLRFYGTEGCCGVNVQVEIAEPTMQDTVQLVDGLEIAIQDQVIPILKDVTIHAEEENGQMGLVLQGYSPTSC